ncbi:MAG: type II toxin-antitoxin system RelE/ParE family toxin [Chromatiaceae bacterium]|jgi:toxin ParE1/3/4|nr:type II toxin-antitoxin system RelE/ParE family toxin [Chromatiaceae bacterium]
MKDQQLIQLIIAPAARDDLVDIHEFGGRTWGNARSARYLQTLKERFLSLTQHPLAGVERADLMPGIRSLSAESHVIFYRVREGVIEIVRVLHGRQDPNRHIK